MEQAIETIQTKAITVEENTKNITEKTSQTSEIAQKSAETLSLIQQKEKEANASVSDVETLKGKVDTWAKEIKDLAESSEKIKENLDEQDKKLTSLIDKTETAHKRVEDLLPGAASAGLASAFRTRKEEISRTKRYWVGGFVASLVGLVIMVLWLVNTFPLQEDNDLWTYLLRRIPLIFPFVWSGWFFGRNYGHVVRLEEDYAFKESISRSFEGYKKQMQEVDPEKALPQLCNSTICILSEAPLRVFDRKTSDETPANSFLERFMPKRKQDKKE